MNYNHKGDRGQSLVLKGISYCLMNRFIDTIYFSVLEIESGQETLGVNVLSNQCEHDPFTDIPSHLGKLIWKILK